LKDNLLGWVRAFGFVEGLSAFALFCIAMPMKYIWQSIGKDEFYWIGMAHGILWGLYALIATVAALAKCITWGQWFRLGLLSMLPLGPLFADRWVLRTSKPQ
jgi:integral membrane protein